MRRRKQHVFRSTISFKRDGVRHVVLFKRSRGDPPSLAAYLDATASVVACNAGNHSLYHKSVPKVAREAGLQVLGKKKCPEGTLHDVEVDGRGRKRLKWNTNQT